MMTPSVRVAIARLVLLATAVALMLLGRPTEDLCAQRYQDEHASQGSTDDVSLRSGRRHTPVLRLACASADDDDPQQSANLPDRWRIAVLTASVQDLAFDSGERSSHRSEHRRSASARGPPVIRS